MKKNNNRQNKMSRKKKHYRMPPKAKARRVAWLNVLPGDKWIKVKPGLTVYEALQNTDLDLEGECGGEGTCGNCRIRVITALGPPDEQEKELLSPEELANGERLACRTRIYKNLVIHTNAAPSETDLFQILKHSPIPELTIDPLIDKYSLEVARPTLEQPDSDFYRLRLALGPTPHNLKITSRCLSSLYRDLRRTNFRGEALIHQNCLLAWEAPASIKGRYGIVFDIGTTTLVGKLVDMTDGREVSVISRLNSQSHYGSDIISRIKFVREKKGLKRMRDLLLRDMNLIIRRLLAANRIKPEDIFVAVAAGNTTMQHFLLDLDPSGIAEAPFAPVITEGVTFRTKDLGLALHPDAMLYVMPSKSGYIGGDLISFILSSAAMEQDERLVLGLDLGTNGEIFLGNRKRMLTCSAAAGPALEGARISHGMIARAGAIESFRVENDRLQFNTIGNIKVKGLCGSGLVDLVAVLLHHGVVDSEGLLSPQSIREYGDLFKTRVTQKRRNPAYHFVVAWPEQSSDHKQILLTQKDIRELQLAKGAVAAGIQILTRQLGVSIEDIDVVYLAGALGNYVNPYSAMRIGLIPITAAEKIVSLGNAASAGAKMALLSKRHWEKASEIVEHIEYVELSVHPEFYECFVAALDFPCQNIW